MNQTGVKIWSASGGEDRRTYSRYYLSWPGRESPANNVQACRLANQFINKSLLQALIGAKIIHYYGVIKWAKELIRFPGIHDRLLGEKRDTFVFRKL